MKRWIAFFILIGLVLVTGCSDRFAFAGKSEFWSVACSISPKGKTYEIRYIGDKGKTGSVVRYQFENSENFKDKGEATPKSASKLVIRGSSTLDKPYVVEKEFTLRIQWDGGEEEIRLTKDE
ncbi:hypothetical protein [Paenibacillus flagellatus]|nr:hypothetical protein [Paenibacillus flagellatus]